MEKELFINEIKKRAKSLVLKVIVKCNGLSKGMSNRIIANQVSLIDRSELLPLVVLHDQGRSFSVS